MLAPCLAALCAAEERRETRQPFAAAPRQIFGSQGVGQFLKLLGCPAPQERVRALLEVEVLLAHTVGKPVMLIETDPRRERQVRAHAHKYPTPVQIVDIKVVLHDPAVGDLKMPAIGLSITDRRHDPCRLSGLEDDDDLVGFGAFEVGLDKFVAPALWRFDNRRAPSVGLLLDPGLKLFGGAAQHIAAHRIDLPIAVEKANHALGLLKRLDQPVEQDPVKAAVPEADALLVVVVKGVHSRLPRSRAGSIIPNSLIALYRPTGEGYQGQSPWLVSVHGCGGIFGPIRGVRRRWS